MSDQLSPAHVGGASSRGAPHYLPGEAPDAAALQATLTDMVRALEGADLDYLLMGGLGSAKLGRPRTTDDIDVFVRPEDALPALDALEAAGFETERSDPTWLFKAWKRGVLVDVVFRSSGDIYVDDEMIARGQVTEHKGVSPRIIAPEDLTIIKAAAAAEAVPQHWYDALAILARSEIDWDYFVRRARQAPRRVLSLLLYADSIDLAVPRQVVEAVFSHVYPSWTPEEGTDDE
jgi:predicted nucleotidyltransferase